MSPYDVAAPNSAPAACHDAEVQHWQLAEFPFDSRNTYGRHKGRRTSRIENPLITAEVGTSIRSSSLHFPTLPRRNP